MDNPFLISNPASAIRLSRYDLTRIDQVLIYIDLNYKNDLSAEQLSEESGLNIKKLRAGFKRKTGHQLHEYHFRVRVEKSKDLLLNSDYPLKVIAHAVGFKNESHYCQKFRQFVGVTPNEFRYL
jgi:AraC-like DNA-binding protein